MLLMIAFYLLMLGACVKQEDKVKDMDKRTNGASDEFVSEHQDERSEIHPEHLLHKVEDIPKIKRLNVTISKSDSMVPIGGRVNFIFGKDNDELQNISTSSSSPIVSWRVSLVCPKEEVLYSNQICLLENNVTTIPHSLFSGYVRSCYLPNYLSFGPIDIEIQGCFLELEKHAKSSDSNTLVHTARSSPIMIDLWNSTRSNTQSHHDSSDAYPVVLLIARHRSTFLEVEVNTGTSSSVVKSAKKCNILECKDVKVFDSTKKDAIDAINKVKDNTNEKNDNLYYCIDSKKYIISITLLLDFPTIGIEWYSVEGGRRKYFRTHSLPLKLKGCVSISSSTLKETKYKINCPTEEYGVQFYSYAHEEKRFSPDGNGICLLTNASYICRMKSKSTLVDELKPSSITYYEIKSIKSVLVFRLRLSSTVEFYSVFKIVGGNEDGLKNLVGSSEKPTSSSAKKTLDAQILLTTSTLLYSQDKIDRERIESVANNQYENIPQDFHDTWGLRDSDSISSLPEEVVEKFGGISPVYYKMIHLCLQCVLIVVGIVIILYVKKQMNRKPVLPERV